MKPYTLGVYEKALPGTLTWKEKMLAAGKAGYDFIEISIDETDEKLARLDMSREDRLELVSLMYETGIPIRTMCLSGHRRISDRKQRAGSQGAGDGDHGEGAGSGG